MWLTNRQRTKTFKSDTFTRFSPFVNCRKSRAHRLEGKGFFAPSWLRRTTISTSQPSQQRPRQCYLRSGGGRRKQCDSVRKGKIEWTRNCGAGAGVTDRCITSTTIEVTAEGTRKEEGRVVRIRSSPSSRRPETFPIFLQIVHLQSSRMRSK